MGGNNQFDLKKGEKEEDCEFAFWRPLNIKHFMSINHTGIRKNSDFQESYDVEDQFRLYADLK